MLTAADVPFNGFGIYPDLKDQPVLADGVVRYRGEAVAALVGDRATVESIADGDLPIEYRPRPAVFDTEAARADGAPLVQADKPGNLLIEGGVVTGDADAALAESAAVADGSFETPFVEHAYIEPEAGWAERVGDRVEVHVTTQAPYMDRDETANVLGLAPEQVRIVPTACGGGFGGKLDLSVQPLVGLAAWLLDCPVACVYHRPESMAASTKRHPSRIRAAFGCDEAGKLTAATLDADFNTGAYASWGPTVAGRVPVHATGPYRVPNVETRGRAIFTNGPPSGAFRGFGVPQAAIAHETLMDDLAEARGIDRLEIRAINALRAGDATATGHVLEASVGLLPCLDALRPHWQAALQDTQSFNRRTDIRRGVGIGCMWYGIGNTSMSNPSTMRLGIARDGTLTFFNGAVDIGQGSNTILTQICAEALGVPVSRFRLVMGDTDCTADGGKTSASRQTFVSGKAAELAALDLRAKILRQVNAGREATIHFDGPTIHVRDGGGDHRIDLETLPRDDDGLVLRGEGRFDPPTSPLDERGQGVPYATYGFAAQIAIVEVDLELGTTRPLRIVAAARCRPGYQPDPSRRPDPRRHRAGTRPGLDGGISAGPDGEPARLSDSDFRGRAGDRRDHRRGPGTARPVRRQGCRRARPGADRAGDPRRDPACRRGAHDPRAGAAAPVARGNIGKGDARWLTRSSNATPVPYCAEFAKARPAPATATLMSAAR